MKATIFGEHLRKARTHFDMSPDAFAHVVCASGSSIRKWEKKAEFVVSGTTAILILAAIKSAAHRERCGLPYGSHIGSVTTNLIESGEILAGYWHFWDYARQVLSAHHGDCV